MENLVFQYYTNPYFGPIIRSLQQPTMVNKTPFLDYTIRDGFLYKLNPFCVQFGPTHHPLIKEVHYSSYGGHFSVQKIL